MKTLPIRKIVFAVDAFGADETQNQPQTIKTLSSLVESSKATVEPTYVLSPSAVRVSPEYDPQWEEHFRALATNRLLELSKRSALSGMQAPSVLVEKTNSTRQAVNTLVNHAESQKADLIFLNTHARKGVSRLFLGSFAETLILQSKVPVMTVNPAAQFSGPVSRILFPTDFGQPSRRGFEAAVALGKQLGAKLWLYFKEPLPPTMMYLQTPMLYQYVEEEAEARKKIATAWVEWAKKHGVETELVIDEKPGYVDNAILDFAKTQKIGMIAMVAQSGPVTSVMLGSVTRQVVRSAECPVWIQHSKD